MKSEVEKAEGSGTGIGLIVIARQASSKIEYEFDPQSEGLLLYTISVKIGGQ